MLNYELCNKLKDAGFKQEGKGELLWVKHASVGMTLPGSSVCYQPTLSELIEACGKEFENIHYIPSNTKYKWLINTLDPYGDYAEIRGVTPEEAVANLWLALNKKEE